MAVLTVGLVSHLCCPHCAWRGKCPVQYGVLSASAELSEHLRRVHWAVDVGQWVVRSFKELYFSWS